MKVGEVFALKGALEKLLVCDKGVERDLPFKTKYKIRKFMQDVGRALEPVDGMRVDILKRHCAVEGDRYIFPDDGTPEQSAFAADWIPFLQEEIECTLSWKPLTLADVGDVSGLDLQDIEILIACNAFEEPSDEDVPVEVYKTNPPKLVQ